MIEPRSTAMPRHHKVRWRTNNNITNSTYETSDAQTKKNWNAFWIMPVEQSTVLPSDFDTA